MTLPLIQTYHRISDFSLGTLPEVGIRWEMGDCGMNQVRYYREQCFLSLKF